MLHGQHITPHHLSGDSLKIKLVSTETYPLGVALTNFSNDVIALPPTDSDYQFATVLNVIGNKVEVESYHGIYVAIHCDPASREAHTLEVLRDLSDRRASPEYVHAFVEYADGSCFVYSEGVILNGGLSTRFNSAFLFHFRKMRQITPDVFRAFRGDLLAVV
ncbi:phage tail fiber protein [Caballeronia sp. M23-90]|jgi:hypothetical protein